MSQDEIFMKGYYGAKATHYTDREGVDPIVALALSICLTWVRDYRMSLRRYLRHPSEGYRIALEYEASCLYSERFSRLSGCIDVDDLIHRINREEKERAKTKETEKPKKKRRRKKTPRNPKKDKELKELYEELDRIRLGGGLW